MASYRNRLVVVAELENRYRPCKENARESTVREPLITV
jgi:hypothetical protein